ncbi:glycosyltransferase [Stenotrophomonas sp.]|uniref:glycosyltransferase n=1 Tax=Stenotrophomonas sp. TaxID=69392 RepID=UPI0028AB98B4|nr:glycosyltransferase [Stenotrophomonas sp.]
MIDWTTLPGGRVSGAPLQVTLLGYCIQSGTCHALSDEDLRALNQAIPLDALCEYGMANGLYFSRPTTETPAQEIRTALLFAQSRPGRASFQLQASTSKYLVLATAHERVQLTEEQLFAIIFVPGDHPGRAGNVVTTTHHIDFRLHGDSDSQNMALAAIPKVNVGVHAYYHSAPSWINWVTTAIAADAAERRGEGPLLSIIIPAYNYGRFLRQCVQSVLDQGLEDMEVLVLDNASSDDTATVMLDFSADPRVRYMRNPHNYGAGFNWLNGLNLARGTYCTFLSADDFFNPGHLQRLMPVLCANKQVVAGYTGIRWVDESGATVNQPRHPGYRAADYVGGRNEVADLLIHDCYIAPSAVVYRTRQLRDTWRPSSTHGAGDWEMSIQIAERFPDFAYIDVPGVSYRLHTSQHSSRFYASTNPLEDHLTIVEGVFKRQAQQVLRGHERAVAEHIERRLTLYPDQRATELGARARALIGQLEQLAEANAAPLFSIVLTTWNRPALLVDALNSISAQSLRDFEVILVNDCGEPVEHLLGERDFPLTYLQLGRNGGPAAARNAAHRLARGQYLVYLDDDDLYQPQHLQTLADAIQRHPGEVVYSDACFITERIEGAHRLVLAEEHRYPHGSYSHERLSIENYIPVNTFAWPRALAAGIGGFDEHLQGLEDWDFLLRLAARVPFNHVRQQTAQVRMRADTDERRSVQAFGHYPALYRKIYARHSDLDAETVRTGRAERLKQLGVLIAQTPESVIDNWRAARVPSPAQRQLCVQRIEQSVARPRLCVLLRSVDGNTASIQRSIASLHGNEGMPEALRVIVVNESTVASICPSVACDQVQVIDSTAVTWDAFRNSLLNDHTLDWLLIANAGDEFTPGGLLQLRLHLAAQPQSRAVFADGWQRTNDGSLVPMLRPDLNLDLLLANPSVLASHWVFKCQAARDVGGFDPAAGDAAELGLILRLVHAGGFGGIEHLPEPLLTSTAGRFDSRAQQRTILAHLQARGYAHASVQAIEGGLHRIDYGHGRQPSVSLVVIVSKDTTLSALERCVVSVLEKTHYANYQLLMADNGANDELRRWMQQVEPLAADRVQAFTFDPPLPHTAACNLAAAQASAEFLLFLRPEVAALQPQWLEELLNHGLRTEVGVVGAKTVSGEGKVTHAGLVPGLRASGGRAFAGEAMDAPGYMGRLQVAQQYTAVADSCLLISKALFNELGGFDHAAFIDEGADVDLCLRARMQGYLTVWTPYALLLHSNEPVPLTETANDALLERWLPQIANDPAYNPSLRLDVVGGFRLGESDFSWKPLPWRPIPRVLAQPADPWGSGHYRVIQPFEALKSEGRIEGALYSTLLDPVEQARIDPDVVILQRRVSDEDLHGIQRMGRYSSALKIYELDDYLPNLPAKSAHREHMPRDVLRSLRKALGLVDRFVVSTPAMAEAFAGMHPDIRITPNRLPVGWWKQLPIVRRENGARPRVGWAGGLGHTGDLEMIADVVSELAQEVDWVFFGMCPDRLRPYVAEFHPGVDIAFYPRALASLQLDLAIAPLEDNPFNACKSNLRLLEYGACAVPVVCSDVGPYRDPALPVSRVRNRHREWVGAIRDHLADAAARRNAGDALKTIVHRNWMLEGAGLDDWRAAWLP